MKSSQCRLSLLQGDGNGELSNMFGPKIEKIRDMENKCIVGNLEISC